MNLAVKNNCTKTKILFKKNRKDKVLVWWAESSFIQDSEGKILINIFHGQHGGTISQKVSYVNSGKNKGKSNETTIEQQTQLKIDQLYQGKVDDGMVYDLNDYTIPQNPMLAKPFADRAEFIEYTDCYTQRKLNGIRCFAKNIGGEISFISRTGKAFTNFPNIERELLLILKDGDTADGELFHPDYEFEVIASEVNKETNSDRTGFIQFHCYDFIPATGNVPFIERVVAISTLIQDEGYDYVIPVETTFKKDFDGEYLYDLCVEYMKANYEGVMVRDPNGLYEFSTSPSHRSDTLLKYKLMEDKEFEIVDIIPSENEPDQPKFIVKVSDTILTPVRLKGSKADNAIYLLQKEKYIGKWMKVQFQCYTKYGDLSFPVGLGIRDGEVIDGQFIPDQ